MQWLRQKRVGSLGKLNGGPLLFYTPLDHDLSAPAIKRNNAFHK